MPEYRHLTCYMQLAVTDYCVEFPLWIWEAFRLRWKQNKQTKKNKHPPNFKLNSIWSFNSFNRPACPQKDGVAEINSANSDFKLLWRDHYVCSLATFTHTYTNSLHLATNFLVMDMQYKATAKHLTHDAVDLAEKKKLTCIPLVKEKFHQYMSGSSIQSYVYVLLMTFK